MQELQRRFLNNFGLNKLIFRVAVYGLIVHVFWCYLFVVWYPLDIDGLALASTLTNLFILIMLWSYTKVMPEIQEALVPFDNRAF